MGILMRILGEPSRMCSRGIVRVVSVARVGISFPGYFEIAWLSVLFPSLRVKIAEEGRILS